MHAYMCECPDQGCVHTMKMPHKQFLKLAQEGPVRHPACRWYQGKGVL